MKEYLLLVLMISVLEGCRSNVKTVYTHSSLSVPVLKYYTMSNSSTAFVVVEWDPVEVEPGNPILGYKIKIWEHEKQKLYNVEYDVDGKQIVVEIIVPIDWDSLITPTYKSTFEAVVPPKVFEATFNVKKGVDYEIRGQTFNHLGDGPLSQAQGLNILARDPETK